MAVRIPLLAQQADDSDDDTVITRRAPGLAVSRLGSPAPSILSASPTRPTFASPLSSVDSRERCSPIGMGATKPVESARTRGRCEDAHDAQRPEVVSAPPPAAAQKGPKTPQFLVYLRRKNSPNTSEIVNTKANTVRSAQTAASPRLRPSLPCLPPPPPQQPAIVRTTSSHGNLPLCQPVPDAHVRSCSGAYAGNISKLEASAERLSRTNSLDNAIREEHRELKRSDSRRSSILSANARQLASRSASASSLPSPDSTRLGRPAVSRQTSILDRNAALRNASLSDYIMSLTSSTSASSVYAAATHAGFAPLSRHGTGKTSIHSSRSGQLSLPEIAEAEPPVTLTQSALDAADVFMAADEHRAPDKAIRSEAFQTVELNPVPGAEAGGRAPTPSQAPWEQPSDVDGIHPTNYIYRNQMAYEEYHPYDEPVPGTGPMRSKSSASATTYEQAQTAFGDFDGVHCDPDAISERFVSETSETSGTDLPTPPEDPPSSYFDPTSGRQMLFYPARVPAMLHLPPKLSKNKAAERNTRRSQIISMIAPNDMQKDTKTAPKAVSKAVSEAGAEADSEAAGPSNDTTAGPSNLRRPARLTETEKRKSRMAALGALPPQLRASAFFDLPASTADIQLKNGSASDTLDSILDAAATAPVSAFTDHIFAGRFGAAARGIAKKRNKRNTVAAQSVVSVDKDDQPRLKSRGSFASLMGHIRKTSEPAHSEGQSGQGAAKGRRDMRKDDSDSESSNPDAEGSESLLAPDDDEQSVQSGGDSAEEEEDEADIFEGAPTTLLAELQLRKAQQKLRTQPMYKTFPNGMRSTLLQLDTVAQVEKNARMVKKVNLAWEDPSALPENEADDDEDVPLGLLYAARTAGHNDITAAAAEMNRPLGLMERKDLEDNEPLSRRRDRLQGRNPPVSMYLGGGDNAPKRQSVLTLTGQATATDADEAAEAEGHVAEVDDEPMAARLQRIKSKEESELPRARPVSAAFSTELLSQFGDPEEEAKEREATMGKGKEKAGPPTEEEETLGQRRRRLQAEKKAREQEMLHAGNGAGGSADAPSFNDQALEALTGTNRLSRRFSMADILSAHPVEVARGQRDPREIKRQQEAQHTAARIAYAREQKMAALQAQMPHMQFPQSVGGVATVSGFRGGQYNDGSGGLRSSVALPAVGVPWAGGMAGHMSMGNLHAYGAGQQVYGGNMQTGTNYGYGYNGYNGNGQQPMGGFKPNYVANPYASNGAQAARPGQVDRVERWRRSVMP